ncbi:endonuclease/exonuclease/phosphatase family protein [Amylocarpus encephaloides]|uniref:Endonuclease/exonuclease/phosphatase family protein n=1 Tax=Amylocarpus encephaloides TaxID=45428 RepID=A0A9P7YF52_9HELO|nr:endonuclease/exonuclease/phosphatase family protein [Amylocarpus encephaloides]
MRTSNVFSALYATLRFSLTSALTISQINGHKYLSPYNGQDVTAVKGLVTAKGPSGFWIRSTTLDLDYRSSNSIYVFGSGALKNVTVGDIITLDGTVSEYRSSAAYVYLTEIISPKNIALVSSGNKITPIVIGEWLLKWPPTEQFSSLDNWDVFSLPNNRSQLSVANPSLQPLIYGMDFWESMSGELVTVKKPKAVAKPNSFRDTWVTGSWRVSGRNKRGGLTSTNRDSNPEAILIGDPLDGTDNPKDTKLGDVLEQVTGVVTQAFGYYRILPTTALKVTGSASPETPPVTSFVPSGDCSKLTVGSYNVENLTPKSTYLPSIAKHIVEYLKSPNLMFLQEIQDNNGATNNGVVDSNLTLSTLVESIRNQSGVSYAFTSINPVNNQDGGQPGGNIRVAYLYNPSVLRLRKLNPGSSTDANEVLPGPELKFNPGRIDPLNTAAWTASRKPLAAAWETLDGKNKFFTVNVHFGSKGGSSSIEGDARPPVNGGIEDRMVQANVTASFISQILAQDRNARIISSGDFNEFAFVSPMETFKKVSKLQDLDEVTGILPVERYSYLFDMNCQELDHMFVSRALAKSAEFEHVHVNTWATSAGQISDHDPSVARFNVCEK